MDASLDGNRDRKLELNWSETKEMNRGAQGIVYRVPSFHGRFYAVKTHASNDEIERLSRLHHRNIVHLIEITVYQNRSAMVMEYVDRNLRQHLDRGLLSKLSFLDITGGIADGLMYIHAQGMVHRDIKSDNVLVLVNLAGQCIPKIVDFGIAREIPERWTRMRIIGSYPYMAPELLSPPKIEGTDEDAVEERFRRLAELEPRVDTWSFGVLAWEILTCIMPYEGCDQVTLPTMVANGLSRIPIPRQTEVESLQIMLQRCLEIKPENRSTMPDVVEILSGIGEEMLSITEMEWRDEQERYLREQKKHGFRSRSQTDMMRSRDLRMRKLVSDCLKECWDNYVKTILKNILLIVLILTGCNRVSANNTVIWVSDRLYKFGQSDRYRNFIRHVEKPIAYVGSNIPILLRDGPASPHFIPYDVGYGISWEDQTILAKAWPDFVKSKTKIYRLP